MAESKEKLRQMLLTLLYQIIYTDRVRYDRNIKGIINQWLWDYYKIQSSDGDKQLLWEIVGELKTNGLLVRDASQDSDEFLVFTSRGKALVEKASKDPNKFNFGFPDFWNLIHPDIIEVSKKRFDDGNFADSVEAALKEANTRVKLHYKKIVGSELDGAPLMTSAFSLSRPVITLDDLSTTSGKDAQIGYMQIFSGAMTGIRNPKAHENLKIDEQRAIHHLFLASLLMFKLDEAKVPSCTDKTT